MRFRGWQHMSKSTKTVIPAKAGQAKHRTEASLPALKGRASQRRVIQKTNGLVPRLRFPEFRDAGGWAIKPLGKILSIGNGKDHKHLPDGDVPVYGSGGYMRSVNDYLYDGESVCIGRKGTIDKPVFLSGRFWTVDTLFYTHSFRNALPRFVFALFQSIEWLKHNEAGGVPSLSKANIAKIEVAIPEVKEQQKIADCLSSLDALIAAQVDKIDALKTHKKGLMQQLFPREDETVPRLRFPEFRDAGEWKEKKLGRLIEEYREKSTKQDEFEVLTSAREGLVRQRDYYDNSRITERNNVGFNVIPPCYMTYRSRSDDRRFFFNENNLGITGIISTYYPVFRMLDGSNKFFVELLSQYSRKIGKHSVGTSQTVLSMNELRKIELPIPKKEEQQEIADCLSSLDALIAAYTEKLDALKAHKTGLMQQLFPRPEAVGV